MKYKIIFDVEYSGDDELLNKTFETLESSKRTMPAHFCDNSFEIEWDKLDRKDEYNMASMAWNVNFDKDRFDPKVLQSLSAENFSYVVVLSENIMLGSYILSKLNADKKLYNDLLMTIISGFKDSVESKLGNLIISAGKEYFNYCTEYGISLASNKQY